MVRDPFPNNQVPSALWDAVARNTLDQGLWDTPELDRLLNNQPVLSRLLPALRPEDVRRKLDQVISLRHQRVVLRQSRVAERNNSAAGRYGVPPGSPTNLYQLQKTPSWLFRASENWVINNNLLHRFAIGYNRFDNNNSSVYFNQGWPSTIGLTNMPDTTFPRLAMGGAAILGDMGNFGSNSRGNSDEGSPSSRTT